MADTLVANNINTAGKRISTRAAFFIAGFAMGAWAPLVPYAQHRLNLDPALLGLLLLCLGCGSLITMIFSGKLAGKFGCRTMILIGVASICLSLPLLATVSTLSLMVPSLLLFGAGVGLTDVTVNIQGALVEQKSDKPLMSGFHGLFSVGGIAGSAGGSLILSSGFSPLQFAFAAIILILIIISATGKSLLPFASNEEKSGSPLRINLRLVIISVMCMVCFLAEGSMLDWGGIWLTAHRHVQLEHAGWGYAVFGTAMAIMRLSGDVIVNALGRQKVLILSGVFAMAGFAIAVYLPGWLFSLLGFAFIGIGAANVAPVLTTLAGKETIMPSNMSVAFVSTVGYLGILMGPALIGFIANMTSLQVAFLCMSVSMICIIAGAFRLRF
ncbi:MFS transporter [Tatumella sp. JGM118]|uniref:MFS transporter n=1 Tax=Tatumella sp. JGM118 TaxID=2799796 RepID=UPI001BAEE16B|nr:MFS transporter [Tatumella sp. JGM118]MBS0909149.1 MFS transporter [Tatumella sp. JGM118]